MLQQTRVETVVPYYERFMDAFPTPSALAEASEDEVLSHWSGLGYYRRARLLHAGAKHVVAQHEGQVPAEPEARKALPGVGRYTAGAIGSIAFGLAEPIVDGNVARVMARVHAITTPLGDRETEQRLWQYAEGLMHEEQTHSRADPGAVNQALMELGALVCTPKQPDCVSCPVADHCQAIKTGQTATLPVPKKRKAPKAVSATSVCAYNRDGRVWLTRGERSLFGGLWGPPMEEGTGLAHARQALQEAGLSGQVMSQAAGTVEHTLTHRQYTVRVYQAFDVTKVAGASQAFESAELPSVGISRLTTKVLAMGRPKDRALDCT